LGPRRATWPRKRRRQRKQRRQPKRKRSNRSTKPLSRIALTSVTPIAARTAAALADRISAQQTVRPDHYADGCCITVRSFIGTRSSGRVNLHAANLRFTAPFTVLGPSPTLPLCSYGKR
jgi:hypothetical protein